MKTEAPELNSTAETSVTVKIAGNFRAVLIALIAVLCVAVAIVEFASGSADKPAVAISGSQAGGYILLEGETRNNVLVFFDPGSKKILIYEDLNDKLRLRGVRPTEEGDQKVFDPTLKPYSNFLEKGNGVTAEDLKKLAEKNPQE